nr:antitoxin VbhA family protein [Blautia sp. OF11-22]
MDKDPFKEYIRQSEPSKRDKGYAWHTAIGLQAVDGLKPSKYLIDTAIKNIEGDISIDEAQKLLNTYYEENPKADTNDRTEEADKVAVRIAKIYRRKHLVLLRMSISLFIKSCLLGLMDMQEN